MAAIRALIVIVEVSDGRNQRSLETFVFRRRGELQTVPWSSVCRRLKKRCPDKSACRVISTHPSWVQPCNKVVFTI